jgi:Pyrimidine dimer DNA glycosylase
MNIFVLDLDPVVAASYYIDKHCVKMPLEIAQMLCTAINLQGNETPYKPTHKNHPCSVWLRESLSNWNWLVLHGIAVAEEYTRRFDTPRSKETGILHRTTVNTTVLRISVFQVLSP